MNDHVDNSVVSGQQPWPVVDEALRRALAVAKARKGWKWDDVAEALELRGWTITPGNLMTRHSRMAFRADELILLLDVLGVDSLSIAELTA